MLSRLRANRVPSFHLFVYRLCCSYFPRYAAADDEYIILGDTTEASYPNVTTIKGLKRHECDFWDSLHLGLV